MMLSTAYLLIFFGIVAALVSASLRKAHTLEPRGTIDHAVKEVLLSD
jgi:hypothetical protein